jgi:hypothetical protein
MQTVLPGAELIPVHETKAGRAKLAAKKQALPDGSFPIPNISYLRKALRAVGRAAPGKRSALAKLIVRSAKRLHATGVIKGTWAAKEAGVSMSRIALANGTAAPPANAGPTSADGDPMTPLEQQVYTKMKAGGMPDARAKVFAQNAKNLAARKKKAKKS